MQTTIVVRPAGAKDVPRLKTLARVTYAEAFGHSFIPSDLEAHLSTRLSDASFFRAVAEDVILLADVHGTPVGFIQFGDAATRSAAPGDQEIRRLYVRSDFQRKGIGTRLLDAALGHHRLSRARRVFIDVWERNCGARRFYERHGFAVIGAHKFVVASGSPTDDDLVMVRPLTVSRCP